MKQRFVVVTESEAHVQWLERCLAPDAEAVLVDDPSAERITQLSDAASGNVVFVRFDAADLRQRSELVRNVLERKRHLVVVAFSEQPSPELILAAVRAGARDFLEVGSEARELQAVVERLLTASPAVSPEGDGQQTAILCARPDIATSAFAVHTALRAVALAEPGEEVLLVDLALPAADSLLFLDIEPSYTFIDAVRSVRRFDQTLIQTAFSRDRSGLSVLPLPEDPTRMQDVNGNDMLALFAVLKTYFRHTVLNLGGLRAPDFLLQALTHADRTLLMADQSVASCSAARKLVVELEARGFAIDKIQLLVDRYTSKLEPNAEKIAEVLGLELLDTLPPNGFSMIKAMNCAQTIFEIAPDSPYTRGVYDVTGRIFGAPESAESTGVLGRLRTRLGWS